MMTKLFLIFPVTNCPPGMYFLNIKNEEGNLSSLKFQVQ